MTSSSINAYDGENYSRVTTCLALSRTVYAKDEQSCLKMLNKQLQNISHGVEHFLLAQESQVPYLIAYKPHTDEFYLAFRGTESLRSFLPSLKCVSVPNDFQGRVHAGYSQQANLIPLGPFTDLLNSNPTCKLVFTGHSLGGAIAAIVTSNLLFDERSIRHHDRILCIAFGAPFFANEQCAVYMNEHFENRFHFYVNDCDPMPFAFCFVHDCLQQLKLSEHTKVYVRWLQALLGLQESALHKEDQSIISSVVSNTLDTELFEATKTFRTAIDFLRPILSISQIALSKYQPFGECYHIVTDVSSNEQPSESTDSFASPAQTSTNTKGNEKCTRRIIVKSLQQATFHSQWLSMTSDSIIDKLIKSYQDHGIRNYISELYTHSILKSNLGLNLKSSPAQLISPSADLWQNLPLAKFLPPNDANRWQHTSFIEDVNFNTDEHYWSAVSTEFRKEKRTNISIRFRGVTACFFLQLQYCEQQGNNDPSQCDWHDAVRHPSLDEDLVVFEIQKVYTSSKRKMLYRCVHHFGRMGLNNIINPDQFISATNNLVGRKQQVADFQLVELYLAAFAYAIFTQPSIEGEVSRPTTIVDTSSDQDRRKKIQENLFLCEQFVLTNRKELKQKLLNDKEESSKLFKEQVKKIRTDGARFTESKADAENRITTESEQKASSFQLSPLESLFGILSSTSNSLDIITAAIPTLVAMGLMIIDKLEIQCLGHSQLIGVGAGVTTGCATVYLVQYFGGTSLLAAVLGLFLSGIVGYSVHRLLSSSIQHNYLTMLEYIAKSMGFTVQETHQRSYWLEKRISQIYQDKMASYQDKYVCENWGTEFFQKHDLAKLSNKQTRLQWLNRVKCVHAHFTMRQAMSEMLTVGVVGVGKVGKSMLIHKMFGFPTQAGAERTTKIKPYLVSSHFQMLDLPHLTSAYEDLKRSFAHSYTMMNGIIVVLDAQQQGDDEQGEGHALRTIQQLSMEGVDVLYCFNKADILVRDFDEKDRLKSRPLSDDEDDSDDEIGDSSSIKQRTQQQQSSAIWNQETTKAKINEFVNRYKKYGVHHGQYELTYFELNERNEHERKIVKKHLKSLGILSAAEIRDKWLCNFLKDNGIDAKEIEQVMHFRYKD